MLGKPDDDLEASVALEHKPGALTAHRDFDQVLNIADADAVARQRLPVELDCENR